MHCQQPGDHSVIIILHIGPPQNVSLTAHSSTSLHLDWVEPELDYWNGIVDSYGINCTSDFGFYYYADINGVTVDHDVYDLKPFSYYTCCVHAMTTNGDSAPSCDTGKTLENGMHKNCLNTNIKPFF